MRMIAVLLMFRAILMDVHMIGFRRLGRRDGWPHDVCLDFVHIDSRQLIEYSVAVTKTSRADIWHLAAGEHILSGSVTK